MPATNNTVDRAVEAVAILGHTRGTSLAAMGSLDDDDALADGLTADATGLGTFSPGIELHDTVDSACVVGAALGVKKGGAHGAAMLGLAHHGAAAGSRSTAAGLGACGPCIEGGDDAMEGTVACMAHLGRSLGGAGQAAMLCRDDDAAGACVSACFASSGAISPLCPIGHLAVHRALLVAAGSIFIERRAPYATELGFGSGGTMTVLHTTTAAHRAGLPCAECANNTVGGTGVFVTLDRKLLRGTCLAAVSIGCLDLTSALFVATAARPGAFSPC
jgi:hypothetical protein